VKVFFLIVSGYGLFLLQVVLGRFAPELTAVFVIAVAWHERGYVGLAVGFFLGFLAGLVTPQLLGLDIVIYTGLAYLVSSIKKYLYHHQVFVPGAAVLVIVIRNLLTWGIRFPLGFLLPSIGITLVIALPFWIFLRKIFRWKTG